MIIVVKCSMCKKRLAVVGLINLDNLADKLYLCVHCIPAALRIYEDAKLVDMLSVPPTAEA